jgi:hypothetical protein
MHTDRRTKQERMNEFSTWIKQIHLKFSMVTQVHRAP